MLPPPPLKVKFINPNCHLLDAHGNVFGPNPAEEGFLLSLNHKAIMLRSDGEMRCWEVLFKRCFRKSPEAPTSINCIQMWRSMLENIIVFSISRNLLKRIYGLNCRWAYIITPGPFHDKSMKSGIFYLEILHSHYVWLKISAANYSLCWLNYTTFYCKNGLLFFPPYALESWNM